MPRPGYIICSVSGALDQYTNAISLHGVVESIKIKEAKPSPDGTIVAVPLSMRVVAVWLKDEEDKPEQAFETQIVAFIQGREKQILRAEFPPFYFDKPVRRFILPEITLPPNMPLTPGLLRFESRIRRSGEAEWGKRQEYCIVVEETAQEPTPRAPPLGF